MVRILALLLCLSGCAPIGTQVLVSRDDWTGTDRITVHEREIFRSGDAIVTARPAIVARDGRAGYAVLLNVRRRDANGPKIETVVSPGRQIIYRRHDRLRTHCIDGCQKAEVGAIHMTAATFAAAARTGLPLRIRGLRGDYEGTVPAEAFARVLARINIAG